MASSSTLDNITQTPENETLNLSSPTSSDGWPDSEASMIIESAPTATRKPLLTYSEAIDKGRKLLGQLRIPSATLSPFTAPTNLCEWGYTTTRSTVMYGHPFHSTFQALAPDSIITAKEVSSTHTTSTTHDGVRIPSTSARFINAFDFRNGILIAGSNFGPEYAGQHTTLRDGEALPQLRYWSDAVYLQARFLASDECRVPGGVVRPAFDAIKGLRSVVRLGIENKDTNAIVHRIVRDKVTSDCQYDTAIQSIDAGCPHCSKKIEWPGLTVDIESQEGLALLGTPNGVGVAWLLKQHAELTCKTITRVSVWCDTEKHPLRPNLVFWIEDKEPPSV